MHRVLAVPDLTAWSRAHAALLLWACVSGGSGLMLLIWPAIGLNWGRAAYPEIPVDSKPGLLIVRVVGAMALGFGVLFLAMLMRAM